MPSASRPSPSSNVQQARQALADRLRGLRESAGLSGKALAELVGWHPTKISKLEHLVTSPSFDDIRAWCRACDAPGEIDDLIASARTIASAYVEWRRVERMGLAKVQQAAIPLYERTRRFRIFEPGLVPGLFQTPEYAAALITTIISFSRIPDDLAEAVAARMERQHVLRDGRRTFAVVIEEQVLRSRFGDADVMAGQLGRLLTEMSSPNTSVGIIPTSVPRAAMWPVNGFWIFDQKRVVCEIPSAEITVTQPREIEVYTRTFEALSSMAVYGEHARALILAALSELT
ncbi:helix-turn-helix domain-containing protein [Actinomadura madurae]|uniref:helix-turn-helix domain-containing protein n=1 Tax=Actinomadura madurae TaxID=1993 RepID=UPI002026B042|nr:helix-turn-helix transcriptional regulator [Actinomadura madurae]MCP9951665.1 helix-turn-helix domain-containing protein [Actinomadura madurae]MCP9980909.1 helix-turn-helix domain-containing protein [Actinomadura madurae]MCQ0007591.1 helix-turn-helix domain-containing protein [Actinomadura madurae]URM97271.1 helix-turn-helix domain-containing protein [Actinomadura madurae]URN08033.1 helix-turn-helix domain-containing protein [Actinomadura madurae]